MVDIPLPVTKKISHNKITANQLKWPDRMPRTGSNFYVAREAFKAERGEKRLQLEARISKRLQRESRVWKGAKR